LTMFSGYTVIDSPRITVSAFVKEKQSKGIVLTAASRLLCELNCCPMPKAK
jgi:hypothetical protein